jgi:hypothetical protein
VYHTLCDDTENHDESLHHTDSGSDSDAQTQVQEYNTGQPVFVPDVHPLLRVNMRMNFVLEGEIQTHLSVEMHRPLHLSRPAEEPFVTTLPTGTPVLLRPWQRYRGNPMLPGYNLNNLSQVRCN